MSLSIKHQKTVTVFQLGLVFLGSFGLAFTAGSLSFVPEDSSASEYFGIDMAPAISLTVDAASLDLTSESETKTTDDIGVTVGTNNQNGYALTMEVRGYSTGLKREVGGTIPSTSRQTPGELDTNTWGYNVGPSAATFRSLPGLRDQAMVASVRKPAEASTTAVTVGVNSETALDGAVSGTLMFTAVAH